MRNNLNRRQFILMTGLMLMLMVVMTSVPGGTGLNLISQVQAAVVGPDLPGAVTGAAPASILASPDTEPELNSAALSDNATFGWVGIGVNNPLKKLHVNGDTVLFQRDTDPAGLVIQRSSAERYLLGAGSAGMWGPWFGIYRIQSGAWVPAFKINSSGKVGIPALNANRQLNVESTGNDVTIYGTNTKTGNYGYLAGINYGVCGNSDNSTAVAGFTDAGTAIYAQCDNKTAGRAGLFRGNVRVEGTFTATGTKSFAIEDPTDPAREIYYAALEGPEAGTYIRGSAQLVDGEAVIELPGHFASVTADQGLTVQLTPTGKWLQLYIAEKSTSRVVIREAAGQNGTFDYFVQGVRKGYENYQVIRDR
jgi:hypothetical protein